MICSRLLAYALQGWLTSWNRKIFPIFRFVQSVCQLFQPEAKPRICQLHSRKHGYFIIAMEIKLGKKICKWWIFQPAIFGLLECLSCGAWFTKSGKFDHVWIRQTHIQTLSFHCSIPSQKKRNFLFIPFCQVTSFRRNSNPLVITHRCRRLQMKVSHWRCLKWVSCQLNDDVLWSIHSIVSLVLNAYSPAQSFRSKFQWQWFIKVTCLPRLKCGVTL